MIPSTRINAKDALKHNYFISPPLPQTKELMPTFPSKHKLIEKQNQLNKLNTNFNKKDFLTKH